MNNSDKKAIAIFEGYKIRRHYDEKKEVWYFSVVDILHVLLQNKNYQTSRNYWKVLKNRLKKEGSQSVTNCNRLKLTAADGKKYLTDVATPETLLRLIQSVPSPKAEPIKLWLAKVGYERMQDMADPAKSLDRARKYWQRILINLLLTDLIKNHNHIGLMIKEIWKKFQLLQKIQQLPLMGTRRDIACNVSTKKT